MAYFEFSYESFWRGHSGRCLKVTKLRTATGCGATPAGRPGAAKSFDVARWRIILWDGHRPKIY